MRILHTSDWHLGHTLHGLGREEEHRRFLSWLLKVLAERVPDALLITGDVFDSACPPVRAERAFYDFLAQARRLLPDLDVVVIGGNHDSAIRLEAPGAVLSELNVHVIGGLARRTGEPLDADRLLIPLRRDDGEVGAWVAAVPFLRPVDLPRQTDLPDLDTRDPLVEGVRAVYAHVLAAARERREAGQALLATGHCYMAHTRPSELSERKILRGHQHALPVDIFGDDVAYAALGHLHKAQAVGGREDVRYAGSPIPLSMTELEYEHEVRWIELQGEQLLRSEPILVPRAVDLLRIPSEAARPLEEVLPLLSELEPERPDEEHALRPFLEVRVYVTRPEPGLRQQVEEAMSGKRPRLVKLTVERADRGEALADVDRDAPHLFAEQLGELDPRDVFARCYQQQFPESVVPPALSAAFESLLAEVSGDGAGAAEPLSAGPAHEGEAA